jgi:DNA replication protein DnaC
MAVNPAKGDTSAPSGTDPLHAYLDSLKLSYLREHCQALAKEATEHGWSHLAYLEKLLEGEAHLREDRRIQRHIRLARFPVLKTLEQFQWSWPKKINRLQVQNLFRLTFIEEKANVIFLGGMGLGKSHLSTALGYAACLQGHSVLFTTAIDAINTLTAAHSTGRASRPS